MRPLARALALLVLLALAHGGCSLRGAFPAGPYRGRVVDADTKEPLVGAVVLMSWYRMAPGLGHATSSFLDAEEVLTDERGEFVVGTNPPINLMPLTWVPSPRMLIFLPGYAYFPSHYRTDPVPMATGDESLYRLMQEKAVVFELPRLNTREERLSVVRLADAPLVPVTRKRNLIRLVNEARQELHLDPEYKSR